jgi:hypothetical protein
VIPCGLFLALEASGYISINDSKFHWEKLTNENIQEQFFLEGGNSTEGNIFTI